MTQQWWRLRDRADELAPTRQGQPALGTCERVDEEAAGNDERADSQSTELFREGRNGGADRRPAPTPANAPKRVVAHKSQQRMPGQSVLHARIQEETLCCTLPYYYVAVTYDRIMCCCLTVACFRVCLQKEIGAISSRWAVGPANVRSRPPC